MFIFKRFFVYRSEYDGCRADFRMINFENKRLKNQVRDLKNQLEQERKEKEGFKFFADLFAQVIEDILEQHDVL